MDEDLQKARESSEFLAAKKMDDQRKMDNIEKEAMKKTLARRRAAFLLEKALAASQVVVNYQVASAKGFANAGPILGIPIAAVMQANMIASLALIAAQTMAGIPKFGKGGDFVTSGPQVIMVGDNPGGKERVQVTPISSPNTSGPQNGSNVTINVSGNVMSQDFVEGELAEQIKDAIRRGTDFGIN